jgi:hypothetical protein
LTQLPVDSRLEFKGFDDTKHWAQVTHDGRDNPIENGRNEKSTLATNILGSVITGWVPVD